MLLTSKVVTSYSWRKGPLDRITPLDRTPKPASSQNLVVMHLRTSIQPTPQPYEIF